MENHQINPMPHESQVPQAEKSQAGTNLAIVVLVLVIVVVGVKLFMSSASVEAPTVNVEATSTEATSTAANMPAESVSVGEINKGAPAGQEASVVVTLMSEGAGEVVLSVSSPRAVVVREIYMHNPYRASDADRAWVQVYDGYKSVAAGATVEIFKVSLAPLAYDKVRVRALSVATGAPEETVKDMIVTVTAKTSVPVLISL